MRLRWLRVLAVRAGEAVTVFILPASGQLVHLPTCVGAGTGQALK